MSDERTSFIKTPKQLVIVVALAFAVPIVLFALLSQLITGVRPAGSQEAETGVLNRIKPVGELTLVDANAPEGNMSGEQVYQTVCKTCHEAGLVGAPKFGDKAAWAPRIKKGIDKLYASAINGTDKGMPPKGGNRNLADIEVSRGVIQGAGRCGTLGRDSVCAGSQPRICAGGVASRRCSEAGRAA
jgi:cytochrome c5